jgi:hypothetical protein
VERRRRRAEKRDPLAVRRPRKFADPQPLAGDADRLADCAIARHQEQLVEPLSLVLGAEFLSDVDERRIREASTAAIAIPVPASLAGPSQADHHPHCHEEFHQSIHPQPP